MDLWHPRALKVAPSPLTDGGSLLEEYPWRQVLHTTEGGAVYVPSASSYYGHSSWPHGTVARVAGVARIVQHIAINRAARAMVNKPGGVETNRACAVQLEIGWYAARISELPADLAAAVADWVLWVAAQTGVPLTGPEFVGQNAGWQLTTATARQRFSAAAWLAFSGVCGHQHVPENVHWDPGALDLASLVHAPPTIPEDDMPATLTPSWAKRAPNTRLPFFRLEPVDGDTARVFATPGAPLAPGLDKIPAPRFSYSTQGTLAIVTIDGLGSPAVGLGEAPDGSVDVLCANGATFLVARHP